MRPSSHARPRDALYPAQSLPELKPDLALTPFDDLEPRWQRLLKTRLVTAGDLLVEHRDKSHVVVANTAVATRVRLSAAAFEFLKTFRKPKFITTDRAPADVLRLMPHVEALVARHMLVDADQEAAGPRRLRTAVPFRFCGAPSGGARNAADFAILGIPFDQGSNGDCRTAPELLRRKSQDYVYQLRITDDQPRGWFDADRCIWMLEGARIVDAGDVFVEHGESRCRFFDRIADVVAECTEGGAVPVVLGGDRSITGAVVAAMPQHDGLTVVRITPEHEWAGDEGASRQLLRMEHVERVISLGASHAVDPASDDLALSLSASALRKRGCHDVVRSWGEGLDVHLSIDLAVATPTYMRCDDGSGLSLDRIKTLIGAIGRFHRIGGIDLVGLDTRTRWASLGGVVGCQLALAAMSATHEAA